MTDYTLVLYEVDIDFYTDNYQFESIDQAIDQAKKDKKGESEYIGIYSGEFERIPFGIYPEVIVFNDNGFTTDPFTIKVFLDANLN